MTYPETEQFRSYVEMRARFLEVARASSWAVETIKHPLSSAFSEAVAVDVASAGPADANKVIFILSGVHGTELHSGSAAQLVLMEDGLPDSDCRIVHVHGVNAYGCAVLSRTDENNVDPNRNVLADYSALPGNEAYDALHYAICPAEWDGAVREAADTAIDAIIAERGVNHLAQNVLRGQYDHPDGLFYGGRERSWTIATLADIFARYGAAARRGAVLDIHTGVGPKGFGERIRLDHAMDADAPWAEVGRCACELIDAGEWDRPPVKLILEFGTLEMRRVLDALRADNWLRHHGDPRSPEGVAIKRALKDALYVDDDEWLDDVINQTRNCLADIAAELGNSAS